MRRAFAALFALGLGFGLGASAFAQADKPGQNSNQAGTTTIHGTVAGVTAEGELAIDYRTKKAVLVETAYLTVVGAPAGKEGSGKRANVYVVALSPQTKVYQASDDDEKTAKKSEASMNSLEVGDPVVIEFQPADDSDATAGIKQTSDMRGKHGRHRTYFGVAKSIVILPPKGDDSPDQGNPKGR